MIKYSLWLITAAIPKWIINSKHLLSLQDNAPDDDQIHLIH